MFLISIKFILNIAIKNLYFFKSFFPPQFDYSCYYNRNSEDVYRVVLIVYISKTKQTQIRRLIVKKVNDIGNKSFQKPTSGVFYQCYQCYPSQFMQGNVLYK